jgi:hypothetical protein
VGALTWEDHEIRSKLLKKTVWSLDVLTTVLEQGVGLRGCRPPPSVFVEWWMRETMTLGTTLWQTTVGMRKRSDEAQASYY